ncbi:hypothetical protein EMCG_05164 [[Emmonsia] crescens]|uniref:Uncharacterized protein n=1 Tax=[Emmonsia] crescens TaxID=73230 RepID=A0A0G2J6J0_9EURO|nr:hypothetical protein EMCG_05164 [Emmonsia crescens UAMH 3008]
MRLPLATALLRQNSLPSPLKTSVSNPASSPEGPFVVLPMIIITVLSMPSIMDWGIIRVKIPSCPLHLPLVAFIFPQPPLASPRLGSVLIPLASLPAQPSLGIISHSPYLTWATLLPLQSLMRLMIPAMSLAPAQINASRALAPSGKQSW